MFWIFKNCDQSQYILFTQYGVCGKIKKKKNKKTTKWGVQNVRVISQSISHF